MKRSDALIQISRRQFCSGFASCVGVVVAAGCGGSSGASAVDAPPDGAPVCGDQGTLDVGPPSMFVADTPVFFQMGLLWVVRDAQGLYALTARCPHQGFTTMIQNTVFLCPRHGSTFSFNGDLLTGPATAPLVHYAMCMLDNGNVGVLTSQTVAETERLAV